MSQTTPWMLYGASGYTGRLIAAEAVARGLKPVLAGRDAGRIEPLAAERGLEARVFPLNSAADVAPHLEGCRAVLHCAGPFSRTAAPMQGGCLAAGAHYLDITGEIDVIERAAALDEAARAAGVALLPAVGFDVVPSDCLAARLAAALPGATKLQLAFSLDENLSPGTAKTVWENLGRGGRVRRDGVIQRVPVAWKTADVPFPSGKRTAVTIPWGDVASAQHTTGIGDIEVYTALPKRTLRDLRRIRWLLPLVRLWPVSALGRWIIGRRVHGPTAQERAANRAEFWGRASDDEGRAAEAALQTPGGYALTVLTALEALQRVLRGDVAAGFATPAAAFGAEFINGFPGVHFQWLARP